MSTRFNAETRVVTLADAERHHEHPLNPAAERPFIEIRVGEWTIVLLHPEERYGTVAVTTPSGLVCDCGKGILCPLNHQFRLDRNPYVGDGVDGIRRSARIDQEEADTLPRGSNQWERAITSALAWDLQRSLLESE